MSDAQTNGDAAVEERRKALEKLKRPELDAEASGVGIQDPADLDNIDAVIDAILAKEAENAATAAEEAERVAEEERQGEPRYTRDELLENARAITGYRRHFVAGALTATEQTEFTKEQAVKLVKDFLKQPDTTRVAEEEG